jgi:hypothetical protein
VTGSGCEFIEIPDGRIRSVVDYFDVLTMRRLNPGFHNTQTAKLPVRTILPGSSFVRLLMRAAAGAIYRRALAGAR